MHWFKRGCGALLVILTIVSIERAEAQFGDFFRDQAGQFDYYVFSLSWSPEVLCWGSRKWKLNSVQWCKAVWFRGAWAVATA